MATSCKAKPPLYKIVLIGDSGVGKTSIIETLMNQDECNNNDDDVSISSTMGVAMGVEYHMKMFDIAEPGRLFSFRKIQVLAQIRDVTGEERFARVLLPAYLRKGKARGVIVILVYDITNAKSFESLSEKWMPLLDLLPSDDLELMKVLIGNKSDLEINRQVPLEKVEHFCVNNGIVKVVETSARKSINSCQVNVLQTFENVIGYGYYCK